MPLYMKIIIIVAALPVLAFPWLLSADRAGGTENEALVWFYPIYVLAAALCAWIVYGRRPELSWILVVLMLLTHAGIWYLALAMPL